MTRRTKHILQINVLWGGGVVPPGLKSSRSISSSGLIITCCIMSSFDLPTSLHVCLWCIMLGLELTIIVCPKSLATLWHWERMCGRHVWPLLLPHDNGGLNKHTKETGCAFLRFIQGRCFEEKTLSSRHILYALKG